MSKPPHVKVTPRAHKKAKQEAKRRGVPIRAVIDDWMRDAEAFRNHIQGGSDDA